MRDENRRKRQQVIFAATYRLLAEKGYKGTSLLAIAKAAGASNETMYNWFGNKQGLLASMIGDNAAGARNVLLDGFPSPAAINIEEMTQVLERFGDTLLQMLTGEKAVALNRAAAADVSDGNILGSLLAENGREKIVPLLQHFFDEAIGAGLFQNHDSAEMTEIYLALLLGDVQIRRVIGVTNEPDPAATRMHSQRVVELFIQLFKPGP